MSDPSAKALNETVETVGPNSQANATAGPHHLEMQQQTMIEAMRADKLNQAEHSFSQASTHTITNTQTYKETGQATNTETHTPLTPLMDSFHNATNDDDRTVILARVMELAMRNGSHQSTRAYVQAVERAAALIPTESSPLAYWRAEKENVDAATQRLARYWEKRRELFGDSAFLLPLHQTGEGALGRNDLTFLASGSCSIVTIPTTGNRILYVDQSKFSSAASMGSALRRVLFYLLSVACESKTVQADGLVILYHVERNNYTYNPTTSARLAMNDLLDVFPVRVASIYILYAWSVETLAARDYLVRVAKDAFGESRLPLVKYYMDTKRTRIVAQLIESIEGLTLECLPMQLGGTVGYEHFIQWLELRTRWEWDLPPGANHKNVHQFFDFSHLVAPSKLSLKDKAERNRRMNVLHSRRKRERERIEIEVLHEQCDSLRHRNDELAMLNQALELHLRSALTQVATMEHTNGGGGGGAYAEYNPGFAGQQGMSHPPMFQNDNNTGSMQEPGNPMWQMPFQYPMMAGPWNNYLGQGEQRQAFHQQQQPPPQQLQAQHMQQQLEGMHHIHTQEEQSTENDALQSPLDSGHSLPPQSQSHYNNQLHETVQCYGPPQMPAALDVSDGAPPPLNVSPTEKAQPSLPPAATELHESSPPILPHCQTTDLPPPPPDRSESQHQSQFI